MRPWSNTHAQRFDEEGAYVVLLQHWILACLLRAILVEVFAVQQPQRLLTHMHTSRGAGGLQSIGYVHILGPDVELPFGSANDAGQHVAGVNANAHINIQISLLPGKHGG